MTVSHLVLPIATLTRISPSRYFSMQLCSLKEIWLSNKHHLLLPLSPLAHLGSISHKVLQYVAQGYIYDADSFNTYWDREVKNTESEMLKNQIERHLVPLSTCATKYEVKKQMLFKMTQGLFLSLKGISNVTQRSSELWVEAKGGEVGGKIDLAVQHNGGLELIDYKTGNIEDNTGSNIPKEEYKQQMKLYAALYFEKYNIWPTRLFLVGIDQKKYEVLFNQDECTELFEKAKKSVKKINELIQQGIKPSDFANPSPMACKHCSFRPACQKYWEIRREDSDWPRDITGEITDKKMLGNGLYRIEIISSKQKFIIRGLSLVRHNFLDKDKSKVIFCDLSPDTSKGRFIEGLLTTGYSLN